VTFDNLNSYYFILMKYAVRAELISKGHFIWQFKIVGLHSTDNQAK